MRNFLEKIMTVVTSIETRGLWVSLIINPQVLLSISNYLYARGTL